MNKTTTMAPTQPNKSMPPYIGLPVRGTKKIRKRTAIARRIDTIFFIDVASSPKLYYFISNLL